MESNRGNVANVEFFDLANADRYRQIAIDAIAELKALRAWQASIKEAYTTFLESNHPQAYTRFVLAYAAAETELHDEIQNNNRS